MIRRNHVGDGLKPIVRRAERENPSGCKTLLAYPKFLPKIDVRQFGGGHSGMLRQPHVRRLADHISNCLIQREPAGSKIK